MSHTTTTRPFFQPDPTSLLSLDPLLDTHEKLHVPSDGGTASAGVEGKHRMKHAFHPRFAYPSSEGPGNYNRWLPTPRINTRLFFQATIAFPNIWGLEHSSHDEVFRLEEKYWAFLFAQNNVFNLRRIH